jgi:hypothetical protein
MKVPENLIPLVYILAAAIVAASLHYAGVPAEMTGLIVGAAITRVKISSDKP